jgi:hypothetical protein
VRRHVGRSGSPIVAISGGVPALVLSRLVDAGSIWLHAQSSDCVEQLRSGIGGGKTVSICDNPVCSDPITAGTFPTPLIIKSCAVKSFGYSTKRASFDVLLSAPVIICH